MLRADEGLPAEKRPTFWAHFATAREMARAEKIAREAIKLGADDAEAAFDRLVEAISVALVGWERVTDRQGNPVPYDPKRLPDLLTSRELWQLYYAILDATEVTEQDRGNSGSPAPSAQAPSAPPAPAEPKAA